MQKKEPGFAISVTVVKAVSTACVHYQEFGGVCYSGSDNVLVLWTHKIGALGDVRYYGGCPLLGALAH